MKILTDETDFGFATMKNAWASSWRTVCYLALALGVVLMGGKVFSAISDVALIPAGILWTGWNVFWWGAVISSRLRS